MVPGPPTARKEFVAGLHKKGVTSCVESGRTSFNFHPESASDHIYINICIYNQCLYIILYNYIIICGTEVKSFELCEKCPSKLEKTVRTNPSDCKDRGQRSPPQLQRSPSPSRLHPPQTSPALPGGDPSDITRLYDRQILVDIP